MRVLFLSLFLAVLSLPLFAQQAQPVKWTFGAEKIKEGEYKIIFTATAQNGWYVYSQFLEEGGPIPTSFNFDKSTGVKLMGKAEEIGKKKEAFDQLFGMNVISFSGKTQFVQKVKTSADSVKGYLEFMTCNGETCLPPTEVEFDISLK